MGCAIYNAPPPLGLTTESVTVAKVVNGSNLSPKCEVQAIIARGASQRSAKELTLVASSKQWILIT